MVGETSYISQWTEKNRKGQKQIFRRHHFSKIKEEEKPTFEVNSNRAQ